jgi:hypothetical protein
VVYRRRGQPLSRAPQPPPPPPRPRARRPRRSEGPSVGGHAAAGDSAGRARLESPAHERAGLPGATTGSDCWERLLGATAGSDCWQRLLGATAGSDCWQRLLAATAGSDCWGAAGERASRLLPSERPTGEPLRESRLLPTGPRHRHPTDLSQSQSASSNLPNFNLHMPRLRCRGSFCERTVALSSSLKKPSHSCGGGGHRRAVRQCSRSAHAARGTCSTRHSHGRCRQRLQAALAGSARRRSLRCQQCGRAWRLSSTCVLPHRRHQRCSAPTSLLTNTCTKAVSYCFCAAS